MNKKSIRTSSKQQIRFRFTGPLAGIVLLLISLCIIGLVGLAIMYGSEMFILICLVLFDLVLWIKFFSGHGIDIHFGSFYLPLIDELFINKNKASLSQKISLLLVCFIVLLLIGIVYFI